MNVFHSDNLERRIFNFEQVGISEEKLKMFKNKDKIIKENGTKIKKKMKKTELLII